MVRRLVCGLLTLLVVATAGRAMAADSPAGVLPTEAVDLFVAMQQGDVDVQFIARSDRAAKVIIANKTDAAINLNLPDAFAGVPVLAQQFGGGGGGFGGGGGGGGQSVGGGFGGGGGGNFGGGGGGAFSIPPEDTAKLDVPVVCLEHGKRDPSPSKPYKLVPIQTATKRPEVAELMKAFGAGKLNHGATQAAAWHLNNDLSWGELSSKLTGTPRSGRRAPYFSRQQIQAGIAYADASRRLAAENASYPGEQAEYSLSDQDYQYEDAAETKSDPDDATVEDKEKVDTKESETPKGEQATS